MNIISYISQDRAIYFLQNVVLLFIIRHLVVEIDNLFQCCSKSPCSILKVQCFKDQYFRGVVFCDSFGVYGAANLGIWGSGRKSPQFFSHFIP